MKHPRLGLVARREAKGYLFLLPWLLGFAVFFVLPMVQSFRYSLNTVRITAMGREMTYVGLGNYHWFFFEDIEFISLMGEFFAEAALRLAVILVFALVIAMMLNQKIRGKGLFRTLFFLPIICVSGPVLARLVSTGATTVSMIEQYGISEIVSTLLPEAAAKPLNKLFSQLILVLWYSGVPLLIYMTGLQKIDRSLYEAALIDGADGWVSFWKITLPAMRPFILINGVYVLIFLSSNGENKLYDLMRERMFTAPSLPWGGYGKVSAVAWIYTLFLAMAIGLLMLLCRERKTKQVENVMTKEQMRVRRLHAQRAANRRKMR